jgi:hypothetical protein
MVPSSSSSFLARTNSDISFRAPFSLLPNSLTFIPPPTLLISHSLQRRGGGGSKREALGILMRCVFFLIDFPCSSPSVETGGRKRVEAEKKKGKKNSAL